MDRGREREKEREGEREREVKSIAKVDCKAVRFQ